MLHSERTKPFPETPQDPSESVNARVYFSSDDHYKAEIEAREIFAVLLNLCGAYLWERDPPTFDLFQTDSRLGISSFGVSMSFGDGFLDEWYLIDQLFHLSERCPSICIGFSDSESDPILIEVGDVLPSWVHESLDISNRVFIYQGSVLVIIPSERACVPSMSSGAEYLLGIFSGKYPGCSYLRNKQINQVVAQRRKDEFEERSKFALHVSRVKLPVSIGKLLAAFPQLISVIIDHLPIDRDVNKAISSTTILNDSEIKICSVKFTRLQWAKLRSMGVDEVAPFFRKTNSDLNGQLILSGLSCAIVRNAPMLSLAAPINVTLNISGLSFIQKAIQHCLDVPLSTEVSTDDAWLYEETVPEESSEKRINTEPEEFTKMLEKFFAQNSDDDEEEEEDDGIGVEPMNSEEMETMKELELEFSKLKLNGDDVLGSFMDSMNAEGAQHVGPASVLFAHLHGKK